MQLRQWFIVNAFCGEAMHAINSTMFANGVYPNNNIKNANHVQLSRKKKNVSKSIRKNSGI